MSKSIYEEALDNTQTLLALVDLKELNSKKKLNILNQIEMALEQAQKEHELLELYKKHYKLVPFKPGLGDKTKTVIDNSRKIEQIEKELESENKDEQDK